MGANASVSLKEVMLLERDLLRIHKSGIPYAIREMLNHMAFEAKREWQRNAERSMILRSGFTTRSIQVEKAIVRGLDLNKMQAIVGSVADYMATQEDGATEAKKGQHGVPIPAESPAKRKARKSRQSPGHRLQRIQLMPRVKGHRSKQVGAALAMAARRGGEQFAYLRLGKGRQGIYRIFSKSNGKTALRKEWDLSKSSVRIPANPMMKQAVAVATRTGDAVYHAALLKQLERQKTFKK